MLYMHRVYRATEPQYSKIHCLAMTQASSVAQTVTWWRVRPQHCQFGPMAQVADSGSVKAGETHSSAMCGVLEEPYCG